MDGEDNGFATGLSNTICKDGQTTITADIPFNSHGITGLRAPTAANDALRVAALGVIQPSGRLTLTSGTPVLTSTVSAAAIVYYTPYAGTAIPIWNGTIFIPSAFTELSNTLANSSVGSAGPFAGAANAVYDLYVWSNSGTLTLTRSDMWQQTATVTITIASPGVVSHAAHGLSNGAPVRLSTTGALPTGLTAGTTYYVVSAAAGTYQLAATVGGSAINTSGSQSGTHTATEGTGVASLAAVARGAGPGQTRVSGVLTNTNAITSGPSAGYGTYVGSIVTDSAGATVTFNPGSSAAGGGAGWVGIWNMYNRRYMQAVVNDSNAPHTYSSATIRSYDNSTGMRVTFMRGLEEDAAKAELTSSFTGVAAVSATGRIGIGLDSTSAYATGSTVGVSSIGSATALQEALAAKIGGLPGLGQHFYQALEASDGTNANTFNPVNSGLYVDLWH